MLGGKSQLVPFASQILCQFADELYFSAFWRNLPANLRIFNKLSQLYRPLKIQSYLNCGFLHYNSQLIEYADINTLGSNGDTSKIIYSHYWDTVPPPTYSLSANLNYITSASRKICSILLMLSNAVFITDKI